MTSKADGFTLVSPSFEIDSSRKIFANAEWRGYTGKSLKSNATPLEKQAWTVGDVRRRAEAGEVLSVICGGSRCVKCKAVDHGLRLGCACWPDGGWDEAKNKAGGYAMEWGALIASKDRVSTRFMTAAELRTSAENDVPPIDQTTGEPVQIG